MMEDKLQRQRFEKKYRISEAKAQQVRFFVQNYLDCDTYGRTQPDLSYPVHSLYFDSKYLRTYQDTINGIVSEDSFGVSGGVLTAKHM